MNIFHWISPGVANVAYERTVRFDLKFSGDELKDLLLTAVKKS